MTLNAWNVALAVFLLLNLMAGLVRIGRGPTAADRILAAQLFGTTGVAMLGLLSLGLAAEPLVDVALVLAVLAAVATVVFVRRVWSVDERQGERRVV